VVAFLAELPTGPATVARRVRAIDAAHRGAAHLPPGEAHELDEILRRRQVASRFDAKAVAKALNVIPVGGWPTGIVGRRDAAIVALVCAAGLTRAQVQSLRIGTGQGFPLGGADASHRQHGAPQGQSTGSWDDATALLASMPRTEAAGTEAAGTEAAGTCPTCALSRWLRVAAAFEQRGWRAVRAELADYGEVLAGDEGSHDCARVITPPATGRGGGVPLFCAIDRHGAPEIGYPLSTRSITAVVAHRLCAGAEAPVDESWDAGVSEAVGVGGRRAWGVEERQRVAARFAEVEAALDEMEDQAEAIMARVHAAMGDDPEDRK